MFSKGRWPQIKEALTGQDSRLREIALQLPDLLLHSRADNTVKKYRYGFQKFRKWCESFNPVVTALPASDLHVSLYLAHLTNGGSAAQIDEAITSIGWAHNVAGLSNPCLSSLVSSIREGGKRLTCHPVSKKEPITPEILNALVTLYGRSDVNLVNLRIVTMCLIGFAGFFRFSELVNIKRSDISICETHVSIFVEKSKIDVYRDGNTVHISRTLLPTCPVAALERYLSLAHIDHSSSQ